MNDVVKNRIEYNLDIIKNCSMVNLPSNQSFTLEQFVSVQDRCIRRRTVLLDSKNLEVGQLHMQAPVAMETPVQSVGGNSQCSMHICRLYGDGVAG